MDQKQSISPSPWDVRIHRLPLFDVAWKGQSHKRLTWVEVMERGVDAWGQWQVPEHHLSLAQSQLLSGLLSWAARDAKLTWDDLVEAFTAGGQQWASTMQSLIGVLDAAPTSLTDSEQAVLQLPATWVPTDIPIEGLLLPFSILPGNEAKAFHIRRERINQLCPGCALQAMVRQHTNSPQRIQYWSETNLGRGAIAWTSHVQDAQDDEQLVWTALLNTDLDVEATARPGWAKDPSTAAPWVFSLVRQHAAGERVNLGFPLLPMMRALRLGSFSADPAICDLCQAWAPVVKEFGLLSEAAIFAKVFGAKSVPTEKAELKASKLFMRLVPKDSRHPWTVLISRPSKEKGRPDFVSTQSIQSQHGIRAMPAWSYLTDVFPHLAHVDAEVDAGAPASLRRLSQAVANVQSKGIRVRRVIRAFASKPEKSNPNLAAVLNTSFDISRLEQVGERTDLTSYRSFMMKTEEVVKTYRDAWEAMGAEAHVASRQVTDSKDQRFKNRPLLQISNQGVKAMDRDRRNARGQASTDTMLLSAVHQAWAQAAQGLSDVLADQATEESVMSDLRERLDCLGRNLKDAWQLRTAEVRDWAKIHHAYRNYRKKLTDSPLLSSFSSPVAPEVSS